MSIFINKKTIFSFLILFSLYIWSNDHSDTLKDSIKLKNKLIVSADDHEIDYPLIATYKNEGVVIGRSQGLKYFNFSSKKLLTIAKKGPGPSEISSNSVFQLFVRKGIIYAVTTDSGIKMFTPTSYEGVLKTNQNSDGFFGQMFEKFSF